MRISVNLKLNFVRSNLNFLVKLSESEKVNLYKTMKKELDNQKKEFEAEKQRFEKEREREKDEQHKEFEAEKEKIKEEFRNEKEKLQNYIKYEKMKLEKEVAMEKEKSRILENQLVKLKAEASTKTKTFSTMSVQTEQPKIKNTKNFLDLTDERSIQKRVNDADICLNKIASPLIQGNDEDTNQQIQKNKIKLLRKLVKKYDMATQNPSTTSFIFKRCGINVRKGRILRKLLKKREQNVFASERKVCVKTYKFDNSIKFF
jgi:hypothetical protein